MVPSFVDTRCSSCLAQTAVPGRLYVVSLCPQLGPRSAPHQSPRALFSLAFIFPFSLMECQCLPWLNSLWILFPGKFAHYSRPRQALPPLSSSYIILITLHMRQQTRRARFHQVNWERGLVPVPGLRDRRAWLSSAPRVMPRACSGAPAENAVTH